MTVAKSKRIFYFDALRALAIICVIVVHVYAVTRTYVMAEYDVIPSLGWIFSQTLGNCFRIGVDLFLMLAGALSLGRVWTIREFLGKRIPRIVSPFIFWGLVLSAIGILLSYYFGFKFLYSFNAYSILKFVYGAFMSTSPGFTPYWFFWMILGTYLIMPIFNKWLANCELDEVEYFLVIWLITCLFDYTLNMSFPLKLSYFTSPIGLTILGYYLRHTERRILNNPYFDLALVILSAVGMLIIVCYLSSPNNMVTLDRYSLPMALEVAGVFLLFKNFEKFNLNFDAIKTIENLFRKLVAYLARYSYGIYLIQGMFLCIYAKILPYGEFYSHVIVMFILIVASSLITMHVLSKVPYVKEVIGAK